MKKVLSKVFTQYINGTRGVISIFLAILMVPFVTVAGALINAGRVNSAIAIFDEALCNASNSTLGTYDEFLRERFGLMAISQDTSTGGSVGGGTYTNYTASDFINDTFKYYMQQNLGVLSNTYTTTDLSATGLYPLANTSVLFSSVMEASKYTVPTKMAIDWTSLDGIISKLTSGLSGISSLMNTVSQGVDTVSALNNMLAKKDSYRTAITDSVTAKLAYDSAYNNYVAAVKSYNSLIDEINNLVDEIDDAQDKINAYSAEMEELQGEDSAAQEAIEQLNTQIDELEKDTEENEVDYTEEIAELQKQIEELEETLSDTDESYSTAKNNRDSAQATLNSKQSQLESKRGQLESKRQDVSSKKDSYYNKIIALRDKIQSERSAAVSFQTSITSCRSSAESLVTSTVTMVASTTKSANNKERKALDQENSDIKESLAELDSDSDTQTRLYNQMQENIRTINSLNNQDLSNSNTKTVINSAINAQKEATTEMDAFANRDLKKMYTTIYDGLTKVAGEVYELSVPTGEARISNYDYYYNYSAPTTKAEVEKLITDCETAVKEHSSFAVLKTMVNFVTALFKVGGIYNSELKATIDTSKYSSQGGLPSQMDQTRLVSSYDAEDKEQSDYYKELLAQYSTGESYFDTGDAKSIIEEIIEHITGLAECLGSFSLGKVGDIVDHISSILSLLNNSKLSDLIESALEGLGKKVLLTGYICYNTGNRTTYTGSALTGARYSLPTDNTGYCFCGAETEYIFAGTTNEVTNQTAVFFSCLVVRLLSDVVPVLTDATVQALSNAALAVPYVGPILKVLVYIVYWIIEAYLDVTILAGGGNLPIYKSYVFLTPGGLPKLVEKISAITIDSELKEAIFEGGNDCFSELANADITDEKYVIESDTDSGATKYNGKGASTAFDIFTIDYTNTLQLLLLLTKSTDTMVKRLADIIQMESSYNAQYNYENSSYDFNLAYSYTYVRASGNFTSGMFMKMSDMSEFTSTNRVIYTGY